MTHTPSDDATRSPAADGDWQTVRQIGHDLNNLIGAIQGYAEMLLEELPADPESTADLRRIQEAAGRAAELVFELRELSKQAGTTPPSRG
jgi:signal transduction histidine kinase